MSSSTIRITNTINEICEKNNWSWDGKYINAITHMKFKCNKCEFEWNTKFCNIKNKKGCGNCGTGKRSYSLEDIQKIVGEKGCKTLEVEYKDSTKPMRWQCLTETCNYIWTTSFSNINRVKSKRCPKCNGARSVYNFDEVKEIAESKDLICLSTDYVDCMGKMKWKCKKCLREWDTSFRSIVQNIGCIKCSFKETMCLSIEYVREFVKDLSFICLSDEYINSVRKLKFKCNVCDNTWEATFHHIKCSLSGCPNCASYRTERLCRELFQSFIGYNFPKARLPEMNRLELDGYCEELGVAFEYNGIQHYEHTEYFHTEEEFKAQQERDKLKLELCEKNKILLITIPYEYDYKDPERLEKYILNQLITNNLIE